MSDTHRERLELILSTPFRTCGLNANRLPVILLNVPRRESRMGGVKIVIVVCRHSNRFLRSLLFACLFLNSMLGLILELNER